MTRGIYIYLAALMLTLSCSSDDEPAVWHRLNDDFVENYVFGEGSYWIYQRSDQTLDSVYIDAVLYDMSQNQCSECPGGVSNYDHYNTVYKLWDSDRTFIHYMHFNTISHSSIRIPSTDIYFREAQPVFFDNKSGVIQPYEPFTLEEFASFNGFGGTNLINSLISHDVGNNTFQNVTEMSIGENSGWGVNKFASGTIIYFADGVGMIEVRLPEGTSHNELYSWELVRYHIEPYTPS